MDFQTQYIPEAIKTESVIDNVTVDYDQLINILNTVIASGNLLDVIKKDTFYGLPTDPSKLLTRQQRLDVNARIAKYAADAAHFNVHNDGEKPAPTTLKNIDPRVAHAIIGMATETVELLEALRLAVEGDQPIDNINVLEELGDLAWYQAIAVDALKGNMDTILQTNLDKLAARNKGKKFNAEATINRDTENERKILEQGLQTPPCDARAAAEYYSAGGSDF